MTTATGPGLDGDDLSDGDLSGDDLSGGELTELLLRLLTDDDYRERLGERGAGELARNAAELSCLSSIDQRELDYTARRFRGNLWSGEGAGGIAGAFPRSLTLLERAGWTRKRLLAGFVRSPEFDGYRVVPYAGEGSSLEEAFATFAMSLSLEPADVETAESADVEAPAPADVETAESDDARMARTARTLRCTLQHEMLLAVFTALVHEHPVAFRVGIEGVMPTDNGHAVLRRYPAEVLTGWGTAVPGDGGEMWCLYSATPRGVAFGPVSRRVADALSRPGEPAAEKVREALRMRGIW
ncbi:hypothetical protein ACFRR7_16300 [Streptomyces sp. NPDC056909]|uniref:hypothetical protein n=1 Tax=Streptomyces sp. NPDC056909 TaxID=3345963 RepID=UPI00368D68A2